MYNKDPAPIKFIISAYHHYLFRTRKPKISSDIKIDIFNKKILVVDDTIHTGATLDVALKYLIDKGVSEINIATLAYISERKPDFFILPKGNYCFPWSKDF